MTAAKVRAFIRSEKTWSPVIEALRTIILETGLDEDLKWNLPCYTQGKRNIVIIQPFKEFCALMYFDGYRLTDKKGLLQKPGENSQTARRLEFVDEGEVLKHKAEIKRMIKESLALEPLAKAEKPKAETKIPKEFSERLAKSVKLKKAFDALTPGRQRQYLMHFASAKQEATRIARIEKCLPNILAGLGMNE